MGGNHQHGHHHHGSHHHHGHDNNKVYDHLLNRLDANPVTIPKTPLVKQVLSLLFNNEEAELLCSMPGEFASVDAISKISGFPFNKAEKMLEKMADRGMVFDFDRNGEKFYLLLPAIPGFIEFSLATKNNNIPQKELAALWKRVREEDHIDLFTSLFGNKMETQFGRIVSYEDTIKQNPEHEICSYDRVSEIIEETKAVGVVLCHCRHERRINGEETCDHPMEVCLTLGITAEVFARHDIGRQIDKKEAKEIIAQTEELGLVHMLDNVQNKPAFMCNCCSCACDMVRSFYTIDEPFNVVMTSNFIAQPIGSECNGCGKCAKVCPIGAITLRKTLEPEQKLVPEIDESICFGCGVCARACKKNSLHLASRKERLITPETAFHRMALTALERGQFQDFLFANPHKLSHKVAKVMIKSFVNFPPMKKLLLQKEVNSKFLDILFNTAKKSDQGWVLDLL